MGLECFALQTVLVLLDGWKMLSLVRHSVDTAQFIKNINKYWLLPGFHLSDKSLPSKHGGKKMQVPRAWCWISADNLGLIFLQQQHLQLLFLHFKAEFKPACVFQARNDVPCLHLLIPLNNRCLWDQPQVIQGISYPEAPTLKFYLFFIYF